MKNLFSLTDALAVGTGGFIGSVLRYAMSVSVQRAAGGSTFPLGTMTVNIIGCFGIGLLMALARDRGLFSSHLRLFLMVGILGGFTTFSSFAYESAELLSGGGYWRLALNITVSVAGGLAAVWAGFVAAKLI